MFKIVASFIYISTLCHARKLTDAEYYMLPSLYHLDDYYSCLSQKDGLYCVGTFEVIPDEDDKTYKMLKELTQYRHNHNRTLLHRGYCVSSRCPSSEPNLTSRFEKCARQIKENVVLKLKLKELAYCRTHYDNMKKPELNLPERAFLYFVSGVLLLNIIGTTYDLYHKDGKKNNMLMSWSIISNWKRFSDLSKLKDPRYEHLAPIQGIRVLHTGAIVLSHVNITYIMLYTKNTHLLEGYFDGLYGAILVNSTTTVQMFVTLSSFLCVYNLLISSEKRPLTFSMIPKNIIKRVFRISPVHLLVVGYAATWWIHARDGSMWHMKVGSQMEICRRKFWSHSVFIHNFVDPYDYCFIQTWFLAVDMQLYIVAMLFTVLMARYNHTSKPIYISAFLFFASCMFLSGISYYFDWQHPLFLTTPEYLVSMFKGVQSFLVLYIGPMGNIPATLMGILLANLQYSLNKNKVKLSDYKWLVYMHNLFILFYIGWLGLSYYTRKITWSWFPAIYVGVDKFVFSVMSALQLIGLFNIDSFLRRFFSSSVWDLFAHLSLSVMMIHWCINVSINAGRSGVLHATLFDFFADGASTLVLTYALAVPVTFMVEVPMQRFLDGILL